MSEPSTQPTRPGTPPEDGSAGPVTRRLGDFRVHPVGLGAMPLSWEGMLDHRDRALQTVHAALDAGVTHVDSANIYSPRWDAMGHNEALVAEALRTWSGDASTVVVASKAGIVLTEDGGVRDASADGLRRACEASLTALDRDVVDVYYLHRAEPGRPYAEQVANLLALREAGLVRHVAVSNVTPQMLDVALEVAGGPDDGGVVAVQNEFSPRFRRHAEVVQTCERHGIAFVPWSPFGGADRAGGRGRVAVRGVRRRGARARRQPAPGRAGVAARALRHGGADPREHAPRHHPRLGGRGDARAQRGRATPA